MTKHLIFDFGGVFLKLGNQHTGIPDQLAKIFNIPKEEAEEIWKTEKNDLLIGKETPKEFLGRMENLLGASVNVGKMYKDWVALYGVRKNQINWELVDYVEILKKKYQIHMLTNIINLEREKSKWYVAATQHFENIFRSFQMGHKKPNKEVYLYVLGKINAKPEECVFIDDTQVNVDVAEDLGIKGVLYTNFNQLKRDFIALGIEK